MLVLAASPWKKCGSNGRRSKASVEPSKSVQHFATSPFCRALVGLGPRQGNFAVSGEAPEELQDRLQFVARYAIKKLVVYGAHKRHDTANGFLALRRQLNQDATAIVVVRAFLKQTQPYQP